MRYSKIRRYDTSNWDGVNTTIFFSGCTLNCPGCFNKDIQNFNSGLEFDKEAEDLLITYAKDKHSVGVCLLGGEVFQQDLDTILNLVIRIKNEVGKPIHVWSGYTWEELIKDPRKVEILKNVDTLVDGRFILSKKSLSLQYRGSSNQRVIDVKDSFEEGRIITII